MDDALRDHLRTFLTADEEGAAAKSHSAALSLSTIGGGLAERATSSDRVVRPPVPAFFFREPTDQLMYNPPLTPNSAPVPGSPSPSPTPSSGSPSSSSTSARAGAALLPKAGASPLGHGSSPGSSATSSPSSSQAGDSRRGRHRVRVPRLPQSVVDAVAKMPASLGGAMLVAPQSISQPTSPERPRKSGLSGSRHSSVPEPADADTTAELSSTSSSSRSHAGHSHSHSTPGPVDLRLPDSVSRLAGKSKSTSGGLIGARGGGGAASSDSSRRRQRIPSLGLGPHASESDLLLQGAPPGPSAGGDALLGSEGGDRDDGVEADDDDDDNSTLSGLTDTPSMSNSGSVFFGGPPVTSAHGHDVTCYQNLVETMEKILRRPALCDLSFRVGPEQTPIPALRSVVAACSAVLDDLLFEGVPTGLPGVVLSPDGGSILCPSDDPEQFAKMVRFMHTGHISLDLSNATRMQRLAAQFRLAELQRVCEEFIKKLINVSSALQLLLNAYVEQDGDLQRRCLQFIERHAASVITPRRLGNAEIPEELLCQILGNDNLMVAELPLYTATVAWGKAVLRGSPGRTLAGLVARPMKCIRFPLMGIRELMGVVQQGGLVPADVLLEAVAYNADRSTVSVRGDRFRPRGRKYTTQAWDVGHKHPELMLEDEGATVLVPRSVLENGYRNVMTRQAFEKGVHRWRMRVEGLSGTQWVCLGVSAAPMLANTAYNHRLLCTVSSSSNTFASRLAGKPISMGNGDVIAMCLDMKKRTLSVKKESSREWQMKLRVPAGSCRIFACLYRPGNKVTLLPDDEP